VHQSWFSGAPIACTPEDGVYWHQWWRRVKDEGSPPRRSSWIGSVASIGSPPLLSRPVPPPVNFVPQVRKIPRATLYPGYDLSGRFCARGRRAPFGESPRSEPFCISRQRLASVT
jgi:hypothetical protein